MLSFLPHVNKHCDNSALKSRSQQIIVIAVLVLVAVNVALLWHDLQIGTYWDDGHFITLAKSIAAGRGFSDINDPLAPSHNRFPVGFPALLAPVALIAGTALWPYKVFVALITIMMLALCRIYLSKSESTAINISVLILLGVNTLVASHASMVMSEPAFTALVIASLLIHRRIISTKSQSNLNLEILLAFTIVATYFVRTIGIALVVSALFDAFITRSFRRGIIILLVFGIFAGVWALRGLVVSQTVISWIYQKSLSETTSMDVPKNFIDYSAYLIPASVIPLVDHPRTQHLALTMRLEWLRITFMSCFTLLIFLGWAKACRDKRRRIECIYVILYMLMLLPWPPYNKGIRYIYPMLPFFYSYLLNAGCATLARVVPNYRKIGCYIIGSLAFLYTLYNFSLFLNPTHTRVRDISIGATWIRDHAPLNALVLAQDPMSIYLYTQRSTIALPKQEELENTIKSKDINYVIIGPPFSKPDQIVPIPETLRGKGFEIVFKNESHHTYVFKRKE